MFDKYSTKSLVAMFIGAIVLLAGLYLLEAWIAQWLWNDIVNIPVMFNNAKLELSYWQSYGLIWLAHIIFPSSNKLSNSKD